MRALVASFVVHVVVVLLLRSSSTPVLEHGTEATAVAAAEPVMVVDVLDEGGGGGGGGGSVTSGCGTAAIVVREQRAAVHASARRVDPDAWDQLTVRTEATATATATAAATGTAAATAAGNGNGNGIGIGNGNGNGNGIGIGNGDGDGNGHGIGFGFGTGGGVRIPDDVPAAPIPVTPVARPISKARRAKLIYPSRDREVEDEADLFVARVTVDADGDVVGAHMVKARPGARGDQASNVIWSFRYLPALNDAGAPIASTFEQPFQIR